MSKKLAEILFARRGIISDDELSDTSENSCESELNSHIPITNFNLSLDKLVLTEQKDMAEENVSFFHQLTEQINSLAQSMNAMNVKQNQYDSLLAAINTKMDNFASPSTSNIQTTATMPQQSDLFRIPDPIKSIPPYDGTNRKQLNTWLSTAENTLKIFEPIVHSQVYAIYLQAVINKIEGKAKDILCLAGSPSTFDEIREILINAIGDRQELSTYKSQLWQNKMSDNTSVHKYYHKTKEIIQNIKTLSKQNEKYRIHWDAINEFIEEDALAAFIAGLREPYFGYAQAARPRDLEDAYAFLCKFKSKEITANNMTQPNKNNYQKFIKTEKNPQTKPFNYTMENTKPEPKKTYSSVQPMEVDPSMRSRLTLNKKLVYNNEISNDQNQSDNSDNEEENEVNFWQIPKITPKT